jgi:hypothetical protein
MLYAHQYEFVPAWDAGICPCDMGLIAACKLLAQEGVKCEDATPAQLKSAWDTVPGADVPRVKVPRLREGA